MSVLPGTPGLLLFLATASVIALTPGPGNFYVGARTLAGGHGEGLASSFGTGLGGLVHVVAGAIGLSALVLASAEAFTVLKYAGALYLIWLGLHVLREGRAEAPPAVAATGTRRAFREGVLVEATNPKAAVFFIAFIPQFVDPSGAAGLQFALLGLISVALNTGADVLVVFLASRVRRALAEHPRAIGRLRQGSGAVMIALGASLLFARQPA
jgi:threonine/homoserine/homoserine lactone efflux protein